MRKQQSTAQMFEQFYGKSFSEITQEDIGTAEEIDWGEDVGGEII
jgi:antitoxin MazE